MRRQKQIMTVLRRAGLKLVNSTFEKGGAMSDNRRRKKRQVRDFASVSSDSIYYVNLDGNPILDTDTHSQDIPQLPSDSSSDNKTSEISRLCQPGFPVAKSKGVPRQPGSDS